MRQFTKIKELSDYNILDSPEEVKYDIGSPEFEDNYILRMLIKPKYGKFKIPDNLKMYENIIRNLQLYDIQRTGIYESWCYVTIRAGIVTSTTDDEWHFDGSSFRTDIIPERNYIYTTSHGTEYKEGNLNFPSDFDPNHYNLFTFASEQLKNSPTLKTGVFQWYLLSPFCLHRRPSITKNTNRFFMRVCFTDIEGRDVNNTLNPLIPTPFYGRDPVKTFRNKLKNYYENDK